LFFFFFFFFFVEFYFFEVSQHQWSEEENWSAIHTISLKVVLDIDHKGTGKYKLEVEVDFAYSAVILDF